jgi:hypothetical protein
MSCCLIGFAQGMSISIKRCRNIGMAEATGDNLGVNALVDEERSACMP